jgi:hypothetical protein
MHRSPNPPAYVLKTIFEVLQEHSVDWNIFFSNLPFALVFTALAQDAQYTARMRPISEFLNRAATGELPAMAWIDPNFNDVPDGTGNASDDHPPGDVQRGQQFVEQIFNALVASVRRFSRQLGQQMQCLAGKFPAQRNRELLGPLQGIFAEDQGIFSVRAAYGEKADRREPIKDDLCGDGCELVRLANCSFDGIATVVDARSRLFRYSPHLPCFSQSARLPLSGRGCSAPRGLFRFDREGLAAEARKG